MMQIMSELKIRSIYGCQIVAILEIEDAVEDVALSLSPQPIPDGRNAFAVVFQLGSDLVSRFRIVDHIPCYVHVA